MHESLVGVAAGVARCLPRPWKFRGCASGLTRWPRLRGVVILGNHSPPRGP